MTATRSWWRSLLLSLAGDLLFAGVLLGAMTGVYALASWLFHG